MSYRVIPEETVPARVYPYMQPDERPLITVRRHPAMLSSTALPLLAVATLFALRATDVIHGSSRALVILGVLLTLCCLLFCLSVVVWLRAYVVFTSLRLLVVPGWRTRHVRAIPIADVGEMTFIRTPLGLILGYGTFLVKMPGGRWRALRLGFLPYPEQLYIEVIGLLYRDPGQD